MYGLAPTKTIFNNAMNYILGLDDTMKNINRSTSSKRMAAKNSSLEPLIEKNFPIRMELVYSVLVVYDADHAENPLGLFTGNPDSNRVVNRLNILGEILYDNDMTWIQEEDINRQPSTVIRCPGATMILRIS